MKENRKGLSIGLKMVMIAGIPLLILAVCITVYSGIILREGMRQEATTGLEQMANAVRASFSELVDGDYYLNENGQLMKGDMNIAENLEILDAMVAGTDADVTLFYGDVRMATTLVSVETGERIVGTKADPTIASKVMNQNTHHVGFATKINNMNYYSYYEPMYNPDGSVVGMVFVGIPSKEIDDYITSEIVKIVVVAVVVMIAAAVLIILFCLNIGKALKKTAGALETLGGGDLTVQIDAKLAARGDEIGTITNTMSILVDKLSNVVGNIKDSADQVHSNGEGLENTAAQTSSTADEIASAVEDISKGAVSQAEDIETVTGAVAEIGRVIENIVNKVDNLTKNAEQMKQSGDQASDIMEELCVSNDKTIGAIERVSENVKKTDTSVQQIQEAVTMITSIASQTSLLSLNASIEAARAGEAGRGFAVVASEIQKLAEESNQSAQKIEEIIHKLLDDSQRTLEVMNEVQEDVDVQQKKLEETRECFADVKVGIQSSREDIEQVAVETHNCNASRVQIVDLVQNLSAVSEENAASTQETTASMEELNATINLMAQASQELLKMADHLREEVEYFKI